MELSLEFWSTYKPKLNWSPKSSKLIVIYQSKNLDLLLVTPVIEVLKELTSAQVLICTHLSFRSIVEDESGRVSVMQSGRRFTEVIKLGFRLRVLKPDLFIDLQGSFQSSCTSLILSRVFSVRMAGTKKRLTDRYDVSVPSRSVINRHRIDQHLDVLRAIGLEVDQNLGGLFLRLS